MKYKQALMKYKEALMEYQTTQYITNEIPSSFDGIQVHRRDKSFDPIQCGHYWCLFRFSEARKNGNNFGTTINVDRDDKSHGRIKL